jgi:hypothetical protein
MSIRHIDINDRTWLTTRDNSRTWEIWRQVPGAGPKCTTIFSATEPEAIVRASGPMPHGEFQVWQKEFDARVARRLEEGT